jgi:anti-anti-sigma factor
MGARMHRISLRGDYDYNRKDELQNMFDGIPHDLDVAINLVEATYLDSTFLSQLARLYRRRSEGSTVTLEQPSERIRRLLHLVGFDDFFLVS